MIKIIINEQPSGHIRSFEMKGHADFAEHGKDLVCEEHPQYPLELSMPSSHLQEKHLTSIKDLTGVI